MMAANNLATTVALLTLLAAVDVVVAEEPAVTAEKQVQNVQEAARMMAENKPEGHAAKSPGQSDSKSNIGPCCQNGAQSGFEMCFGIGSQHLGCWCPTTSPYVQGCGLSCTIANYESYMISIGHITVGS